VRRETGFLKEKVKLCSRVNYKNPVSVFLLGWELESAIVAQETGFFKEKVKLCSRVKDKNPVSVGGN
jgi:hypothetical protein